MTWVVDLVRLILSLLDRIVYQLIEFFYSTFIKISNVEIFDETVFSNFATRIYTFLALIMLFKVTFSIINYIINPDNFSNSEKGVGKLIQNVVVVLVLIVCVPLIFKEAIRLQHIIMDDDIIGQIIVGQHAVGETDNTHRVISYSVLRAFIKPNCDITALKNDPEICSHGGTFYEVDSDGNVGTGHVATTLDNMSSYTESILQTDENGKNGEYHIVGVGTAFTYAEATRDYQGLINMVTAKYDRNNPPKAEKNQYILNYTPIISTIAGGFVAWIFLIFCFDIAIRTVKLGFLQLIAPIPIISYIDPKSGKSGMFSRWVKNCLSTYADLFIRVAAIYFAIYIINIISEVNLGDSLIINVFVIMGALLFAKQLPKLIEEISGIKLSGDFTLNPMKKLGASPFAAAAIGGIGGAIGGLSANLANGIAMNKGQFKGQGFRNGLKRVAGIAGSSLGGLGSGLFRGNMAGLQGKGKDNAWNAVTAGLKGTVDARNLRAKRVANDDGGIKGWARRRGVDLSNAAGIESGATKYDNELKAYSEMQSKAEALLATAEKEMVKQGSDFKFYDSDDPNNRKEISMTQLKMKQEELNYLRNKNTTGMSENALKSHFARITQLDGYINKANKLAAQAWLTKAMNGDIKDSAGTGAMYDIRALQDDMKLSPYSNISSQEITSGTDVKALKDAMDNIQKKIKAEDPGYRQAQINRRNDQNK